MDTKATVEKPLKVFISYSRADMAFADELVAGLQFKGGFEVTLDRHSIVEGEDWKRRLGSLIADADSIVFLLSPDSVQSQICLWEVGEAVKLSKRILPALVRPLGSLNAPSELAALNYVRFDSGFSFVAGLSSLVNALQTDLDWLREHTRLLARAIEWHDADRASNRLLSGPDVIAAKLWLSDRPRSAPQSTDLHIEYIRASEEAEAARLDEERRSLEELRQAQASEELALVERQSALKKLSRRTTLGLVTAGSLTLASGGLATWGTSAERRFRVAQKQATLAANEERERIINAEAMRTDLAGVLRVQSSSPGQVSYDYPDGSIFSRVLPEKLADPNMAFEDAIQHARRAVHETSQGIQTVHVETWLNSRLYLGRSPPGQLRRALVWAGANYGHGFGSIAGSKFDALNWKRALEACNFQVESIHDPSFLDMQDSMRGLERAAAQASLSQEISISPEKIDNTVRGLVRVESKQRLYNAVTVLVFSGHAFDFNGMNYLVPVDADASSQESLLNSSVAVSDVFDLFDTLPGAGIVALDACRSSLNFDGE